MPAASTSSYVSSCSAIAPASSGWPSGVVDFHRGHVQLRDGASTSWPACRAGRGARVDADDDDPRPLVGGGQVPVQDLLDAERRDRDVQPSSIFSASSRAVISSRPLPVTISRSQPVACAARRIAGAGPACSMTRARRLVGGAGDRGAAPAAARRSRRCGTTTCPPAACDREVGAGIDLGPGGDQDRAGGGGLHRRERGRGAGLVRDRDQDALARAGRARPRRRRARRAPSSARHRPSRRARSCRSR